MLKNGWPCSHHTDQGLRLPCHTDLDRSERRWPGHSPKAHLQREDLDSHKVIHELSLPNTAKATPSLDLQQLQWLQAHQRGWGWRPRVLGKQVLKGVCPAIPSPCPALPCPTPAPSHLMDVHMAVGRLAMSIHPEGQQDNEGEAPNGQQRVGQHREQGGGCRGWLVGDWGTHGALCHTARLLQHSRRPCNHSPLRPLFPRAPHLLGPQARASG